MTAVLGLILLLLAGLASAESVDVKYRGWVDLKSFVCEDYQHSRLVRRICYDQKNSYMLISLNGVWYHYCAIDADTVESLMGAESMGRHYNAKIKGRFDCRTNPLPAY